MPTTKQRYQVTETPQVTRALDLAAEKWPGEPRSRLIVRLLGLGEEAIKAEQRHSREAHRAAVLAGSVGFPDAFPPGYLAELREDWPD